MELYKFGFALIAFVIIYADYVYSETLRDNRDNRNYNTNNQQYHLQDDYGGINQQNYQLICGFDVHGLLAHPYDCKKFLNCANGETHIQDCGRGTVFNPFTNECDWPENVDCGGKLTVAHRDLQIQTLSVVSREPINLKQATRQNFQPKTQSIGERNEDMEQLRVIPLTQRPAEVPTNVMAIPRRTG